MWGGGSAAVGALPPYLPILFFKILWVVSYCYPNSVEDNSGQSKSHNIHVV